MSRSQRKSPCCGLSADSDKAFKRFEHRRERAAVRVHLNADCDIVDLPHAKTYGDPWAGAKDGKVIGWGDTTGSVQLRRK